MNRTISGCAWRATSSSRSLTVSRRRIRRSVSITIPGKSDTTAESSGDWSADIPPGWHYDPGMSDSPDALPAPRASDADRERVVELLRRAASDGQLTVDELEERVPSAYAARTHRDLQRLTADLSVESLRDTMPSEADRGELGAREGHGDTRWIISILGGHDKGGRWRLAPRCTVLNILGGSDIDLNDAELSRPLTELNMYSILGGGQIRVPHGLDVQVSNFAMMGGNGVRLGEEVAPPGAPKIHIRLVSIMGGSDVARGPKPTKEERRRERELRKSRRRDLGP
jgi:hypothetical protein